MTPEEKDKTQKKRVSRQECEKMAKEGIYEDYSSIRPMTPKEFQRERKIGEHTVTLPEPPKIKEIANWDLPPDKQFFQRNEVPVDIQRWSKIDRTQWLVTELSRRKNGYWTYIRGNIEYITGEHYKYLHWHIDTGAPPSWRSADRDLYYIWEHSLGLDQMLGVLYYCNRRSGKTSMATSMCYHAATENKNATVGIQSKTSDDAKKIFKKIVKGWKKVPRLLKPIDVGDSDPKAKLEFTEPKRRNTKGDDFSYKDVLDSTIEFGPSTDEYFDGSKLKFYYGDEVGKGSTADILNRHNVVSECMKVGKINVGRMLYTTTVEESALGPSKELWEKSKLKNGRSNTNLVRYFKPAYHGLEGFIDAYGYSIITDPPKPVYNEYGELLTIGAKTFLLDNRKGKDLSDLLSLKRKHPFTISEAFSVTSGEAIFNIGKLNQQSEFIQTTSHLPIRKGNFEWVKGERDTKVEFVPSENGRWTLKYPGNTIYASASDPFDHDLTTDNRRSLGASYVLLKPDPLQPTLSNCFVCEYLYRPSTSTMFYEDIICQSVYFGTPILIENNRIGMIKYFKMRGYQGYLMRRPKSTITAGSKKQHEYGIPMSSQSVRESVIEMCANYINDYMGILSPNVHDMDVDVMSANYFEKQLDQLMRLQSLKQLTNLDAVVATALTIVASRPLAKREDISRSLDLRTVYNFKQRKR